MKNKIHNEDCIATMLRMPDNYIDLVVTSPPYDDLRSYKSAIDVVGTSEELFRVMKMGGVVVWIINDATIKGDETGTSFKHALQFKAAEFNLHDTMIWLKPHFANPSRNRYHQVFEYMFVFSKGKPKTFNPIKDVPIKYGKPHGKRSQRHRDGTITHKEKLTEKSKDGMRHNVWKGNTAGQENFGKKVHHPAQFPQWLVRDHILTWSNKGDLVYDPFLGSGTTAMVAAELERDFIGSEIDKAYCRFAKSKLPRNKHESGKDNKLQHL